MSQLFSPRLLAILAVLAGTLFVNANHVAHHDADFEAKPAEVFTTLFMHLMPEPLIAGHASESHGDEHGAEDHGAEDHGAEQHGAGDHATDGHADESHGEDAHGAAAGHLQEPLISLPLPGFLKAFDMNANRDGAQLVFTNLQLFQIVAVLLIFLCLSGIPGYLRTGKGDVVTRFFAGFAHWVRDDVVYSVMGKELGGRWLPFFLSIFFFILFMNVMGLLPHSSTATASIFITGGLAAITLGCMLVFGMKEQGVLAFWKNLVPHVPVALWPLMFIVELMGVIVKPVALMLRLFATMMGGHMVVLTFMGLIFFLGFEMSTGMAFVAAPMAVGFAVFIMIIEAFVVLLQAFIFTQLSVIFINASIHPEH